MFRTILISIRRRGFFLVMTGFAVSVLFLALYLRGIYGHWGKSFCLFSYYGTFVGIGIFAIGRIGLFLERKARSASSDKSNSIKDSE